MSLLCWLNVYDLFSRLFFLCLFFLVCIIYKTIFFKYELFALFVHFQPLKSVIFSIFGQIYSKYVSLFRIETPAYFISVDYRLPMSIHDIVSNLSPTDATMLLTISVPLSQTGQFRDMKLYYTEHLTKMRASLEVYQHRESLETLSVLPSFVNKIFSYPLVLFRKTKFLNVTNLLFIVTVFACIYPVFRRCLGYPPISISISKNSSAKISQNLCETNAMDGFVHVER